MSRSARLDRLERSLDPVAAVVRWFKNAHAFGSLDAYLEHEAGLPDEARAVPQIVRQAQSYGEGSIDAGPSADAKAAGIRAARDALFRYLLALKIEIDVAADLATLVQVWDDLVADEKAFVAADELGANLEPGASGDLFQWLAAIKAGYTARVLDYVRDLSALAEIHAILERRYFNGHSLLFPDTVAREQELLATLPGFVSAVDGARSDRSPGAPSGREEVGTSGARLAVRSDEARTLAIDLAVQLVNVTRINTLLMLGEFERAYTLERALGEANPGPMMRIATPTVRIVPIRRRG